MKIHEMLNNKRNLVQLYRQDLVSVSASPLWKPVPGVPQSWRHTCVCCGNILADDTQVYSLDDGIWQKYVEHLKTHL